VKEMKSVKLVFLISFPLADEEEVMVALREEQEEQDDLVVTSLRDGHRRLGYKILTSYVWAHLYCPAAGYVAKTDDNLELRVERVVELLEERAEDDKGKDRVICGLPRLNHYPIRQHVTGSMMGNWSLTMEEWRHPSFPDYCVGYLYVVPPRVGAQLAQAGLALYGSYDGDVSIIEDTLVTGVLREALPSPPPLEILDRSWVGWIWRHLFHHCTWLSLTAEIFANDIVVSKRSSRSGIRYVGPVTDLEVWRWVRRMDMVASSTVYI